MAEQQVPGAQHPEQGPGHPGGLPVLPGHLQVNRYDKINTGDFIFIRYKEDLRFVLSSLREKISNIIGNEIRL